MPKDIIVQREHYDDEPMLTGLINTALGEEFGRGYAGDGA
jgi:hypothetical protein